MARTYTQTYIVSNFRNGEVVGAILSLPDGYNPANKYPTLVMYHGQGEFTSQGKKMDLQILGYQSANPLYAC